MKFDCDVFISYAHIDNESLAEDLEGWISILHRGLEIRLAQLRGAKLNIWRDPKLTGNDVFSETILEQFSNLAVLISVLSPRYIKSEWCLRELEHFYNTAATRGGLKIRDKHRIFKVIKTFIPREKHPLELAQLLGYEFYEIDKVGRPREFCQLYGPDSERKFWAKLEDLAYDIYETLEILEALPDENRLTAYSWTNSATTDSKLIYLAETTPDLNAEREKIRRELEQDGYQILPAAPLPDPPDFQLTVNKALAQSIMSVHLLNPLSINHTSTEGDTLEGAYRQMMMLRSRDQAKLASQYRQTNPTFSRILWMPPNENNLEGNESIQSLQENQDFISTNLESLKDIIYDRLQNPSQILESELATDDIKHVYLDCNEQDLETSDIEPLYEWLEQHFQVVLPDYEACSVMRSETLLKQCEAVLIYYGQASGLWLQRRLLALKKTLYHRRKPLLAKAVYLTAPSNKLFSDPDVQVIKGFNGFSPDLLNGFLEKLS